MCPAFVFVSLSLAPPPLLLFSLNLPPSISAWSRRCPFCLHLEPRGNLTCNAPRKRKSVSRASTPPPPPPRLQAVRSVQTDMKATPTPTPCSACPRVASPCWSAVSNFAHARVCPCAAAVHARLGLMLRCRQGPTPIPYTRAIPCASTRLAVDGLTPYSVPPRAHASCSLEKIFHWARAWRHGCVRPKKVMGYRRHECHRGAAGE